MCPMQEDKAENAPPSSVPLAPFIIFLQPLVPVKDTQTGTGWNTATAQKQIDLRLRTIKASRFKFILQLQALLIIHILPVSFPALRLNHAKPCV